MLRERIIGGMRGLGRRGSRGFTLTEMLIVMVIIAILAAIAYPSYQESAFKTRRKDGLTALLREAQRMERCFSQHYVYNNASDKCAGRYPIDSNERFYRITLVSDATSFTLTATPPPGGAQLGDKPGGTDCDLGITIDQEGKQRPTECW